MHVVTCGCWVSMYSKWFNNKHLVFFHNLPTTSMIIKCFIFYSLPCQSNCRVNCSYSSVNRHREHWLTLKNQVLGFRGLNKCELRQPSINIIFDNYGRFWQYLQKHWVSRHVKNVFLTKLWWCIYLYTYIHRYLER